MWIFFIGTLLVFFIGSADFLYTNYTYPIIKNYIYRVSIKHNPPASAKIFYNFLGLVNSPPLGIFCMCCEGGGTSQHDPSRYIAGKPKSIALLLQRFKHCHSLPIHSIWLTASAVE